MKVVNGNSNMHAMLRMYAAVAQAPEVEIRGRKVRNVRNMAVVFNGASPIVTNFRDRNFNLAYAKKEWLWYLGADKYDDSICEHAKMWAKLQQKDGSFYSNYGQYIFGDEDRPSQFKYCLDMLKSDTNSRRASIVLLQPYHLFSENTDTVCTYGINFTIEQGHLHMTVMMRSNDVIFGFTNDAFCFSMLFQYMYQVLKHSYPELKIGEYTHFTNSMHVYEPHYDMIKKIVAADSAGYTYTNVPPPTAPEVAAIVHSKGKEAHGDHFTWLTT